MHANLVVVNSVVLIHSSQCQATYISRCCIFNRKKVERDGGGSRSAEALSSTPGCWSWRWSPSRGSRAGQRLSGAAHRTERVLLVFCQCFLLIVSPCTYASRCKLKVVQLWNARLETSAFSSIPLLSVWCFYYYYLFVFVNAKRILCKQLLINPSRIAKWLPVCKGAVTFSNPRERRFSHQKSVCFESDFCVSFASFFASLLTNDGLFSIGLLRIYCWISLKHTDFLSTVLSGC